MVEVRNLIIYPGGLDINHRRSHYTDLAGDLLKHDSADMVMDAQGQGLVQKGAQKSLTKGWPRKVSLSF